MTRRLCLPVEQWPDIDRARWELARSPNSFGAAARLAGRWSARRCRIVEQAYGQWLAFLATQETFDPALPPEQRASNDALRAFILALQARVCSCSTAMMVQALLAMLRVMAPKHDWEWLASVVSNLKRLAKPSRDKRGHMVGPEELFELGMVLLQRARHHIDNGLSPYHAAIMGRDGLMIALLICTPVRIANLTMIELGQHLVHGAEGYGICFAAHETKTGRPYKASLPDEVAFWIDYYLTVLRPLLLAHAGHEPNSHLWISGWGTALGEAAIRVQIKQRTQEEFGLPVWPHLFRAIASTSFVDHAPEQVQLLPDLLGHADVTTAHRYYVLSSSARAHADVQSALLTRREAALRRIKATKTSGRGK